MATEKKKKEQNPKGNWRWRIANNWFGKKKNTNREEDREKEKMENGNETKFVLLVQKSLIEIRL